MVLPTRLSYQRRLHGSIPLNEDTLTQCQGKVDEMAGTDRFLIGDEGGFITGQSIHANGGTAFF
jgi:hypothetical protein